MNENEYIERMRELQSGDDPEVEHSKADAILCEVLNNLGYSKLVEEYLLVCKWYA